MNKELPLGWQFAGLSSLWIAWLSAAGWVTWREQKLAERGYYFDRLYAVHGTIYADIPLVLVLAGLLFFWRVRAVPAFPFVYQLLYCVFAALTLVATAVLLFEGLPALRLPAAIRE